MPRRLLAAMTDFISDNRGPITAITGGASMSTATAVAGVTTPGMPTWAWSSLAGLIVTIFLGLVGRAISANDTKVKDALDLAKDALAQHHGDAVKIAGLEARMDALEGACAWKHAHPSIQPPPDAGHSR